MGHAVPATNRLKQTNCEAPAKTNMDIPMVATKESPAVVAKVPNMMPKGMAPTIKGKVSFAPSKNRDRGEIFLGEVVSGLFIVVQLSLFSLRGAGAGDIIK